MSFANFENLIEKNRQKVADKQAELTGKVATQVADLGPGAGAPEVFDLGDGIKVLEGQPAFNKKLRQFFANLFTEQAGNATAQFGRGEFADTLAALGGPAAQQGDGGGGGLFGSLFSGINQGQDVTGASAFSAGRGAGGAISGAGTGFAIGGPIGAGIGGGIGLLQGLGGGEEQGAIALDNGASFQPQFQEDPGTDQLAQLLQLFELFGLGQDGGGDALPITGASPHMAGIQGASPLAAGTLDINEGNFDQFAGGQDPTEFFAQQQAPTSGFTAFGGDPVNTQTQPMTQPVLTQPPPPTSGFTAFTGDPANTSIAGSGVDPNDLLNQAPGGTGGVPSSGIPQNNALADIIQQFSLPSFANNTSVGPTPLQQQSTDFASDFLATNPFTDTANIQSALQSLIGGQQFDNTPQFQALEAINKRRLGEESAQLNELFGSQGARFGSDIARGQGELSSRALENESLQRAQIAQQSFQQAQQNRLGALPLPGQLGQQQLNQATSAFNIGQANQSSQERDIQRQMAEFARTQGALFPLLLQFAGLGAGPDQAIIDPEQFGQGG